MNSGAVGAIIMAIFQMRSWVSDRLSDLPAVTVAEPELKPRLADSRDLIPLHSWDTLYYHWEFVTLAEWSESCSALSKSRWLWVLKQSWLIIPQVFPGHLVLSELWKSISSLWKACSVPGNMGRKQEADITSLITKVLEEFRINGLEELGNLNPRFCFPPGVCAQTWIRTTERGAGGMSSWSLRLF